MDESLRIHSLVRILKKEDSSFCGMGFLIGPHYILTCMHVVLTSLDMSFNDPPPTGEVLIDFPGLLPMHQTTFARIINGRECFHKDNQRDTALLELIEPENLILEGVNLLAINNDTYLQGIPCSFFISKDETDYGWGEGVISSQLIFGRIQINQMLSGAGILAATGFSGTPVFVNHMNGVVGMLDQVIENQGVISFIPNYILKDVLPGSLKFDSLPLHLQNTNAPKFPHDYIKRDNLLDQIYFFLNETGDKGNLIVLSGPSGSGKTNVVLDVFYNYKGTKYWFDCKKIYNESQISEKILVPEPNDLIIIDNLTFDHDLFIHKWLLKYNCQIIVIICEDLLAERISEQYYKNQRYYKIVKTIGFDLNETESFFRITIPENLLSQTDIEKFHKMTLGIPVLIQFLKTIILDERNIIEAEKRFTLFSSRKSFKKYLIKNDFTTEEINRLLVNEWLKKLTPASKKVIEILSLVPIVGMSSIALRHTSQIKSKELQEAVLSLCNSGFIQLQFKDQNTAKTDFIMIHDLVKVLVKDNNDINDLTYTTSYISYLESTKTGLITEEEDLITKIDILMLQMRKLFREIRDNEISYEVFLQKMQTIDHSVKQHIPFGTGSSVNSEWISKFLENVIPTADCAILISLGQTVNNFYQNAFMSKVIWQGAYNYDSWARACCIHASISHWKRLGNSHIKEAKQLMDEWINNYFENPQRFAKNKGKNKYYDNQIDLDIGTFLGGLCQLGYEDMAIEYLTSERFRVRHTHTVTSDLVVILFLESHDSINGKLSRKAQQLINSYFRCVSNSSAKYLADMYLDEKGYTMPKFTNLRAIHTNSQFGATISCAAYNQTFRNFTYANGDKSSLIGGILPQP